MVGVSVNSVRSRTGWRRARVAATGLLVAAGVAMAVPAYAVTPVVTPISVGLSPYGVAVAPNGTVYTANNGEDSVSVIDAGQTTVAATINLPSVAEP